MSRCQFYLRRSAPELINGFKYLGIYKYLRLFWIRNYKNLPNALRKYREVTGLSQKALADRIGVDSTWLSHWESGDTLPNLISAIRISAIHNIPVNELFSEIVKRVREGVL
jgi:DNA-binding XRE family transcriptional regulator